MLKNALVLTAILAAACSVATAGDAPATPAKLTAEEIVARNVAARGGLQAWRSVQTMSLSGKMEAGGNNGPVIPTAVRRSNQGMPPPRPTEQVKLPFTMELKRPMKQRVEIQFKGQTAVQVFDGTNGWKLRPFLNRKDVEPYTPEEMKSVQLQSELDGPLVDYAAKGNKVELVGVEKVENRQAYNLKLTLKSGAESHVWIDTETFLEDKISGTPRRLDGKIHPVEVYYRDYRTVGNVKVPYLLETRVLNTLTAPGSKTAGTVSEQMVLDKVEVNPTLADALFTKQQLEAPAGGAQPVTHTSFAHP